MEESVKKCYQIVSKLPKLSCQEIEKSLKLKEQLMDKNIFIEGFLPKLFAIVYGIYKDYQEYFNSNYDFEDFFYDSIEVLIKLYDKWEYLDSDMCYTNYLNFINLLRFRILSLLSKTYPIKVEYRFWKKIMEVLKFKKKYFDTNGVILSNKKLQELTGCSTFTINNLVSIENLDNVNIEDNNIDDFIDNEFYKEALVDILKLIDKLDESDKEIIYEYFGFTDRKNVIDIAHERGVSRQWISYLKNRIINKIRENELIKEKYF